MDLEVDTSINYWKTIVRNVYGGLADVVHCCLWCQLLLMVPAAHGTWTVNTHQTLI